MRLPASSDNNFSRGTNQNGQRSLRLVTPLSLKLVAHVFSVGVLAVLLQVFS
jgi:hypothetical protein